MSIVVKIENSAYHMQNTLYKLYDKTDFTRQIRIIELPGKPIH